MTGVVGLPVVPTVLGCRALQRESRGAGAGRRRATAGVALGLAWVVVWMLVGLSHLPGGVLSSQRLSASQPPSATAQHAVPPTPVTAPPFDPGTCLDWHYTDYEAVSCDGPHTYEVTDAIWLGSFTTTFNSAIVQRQADVQCGNSWAAMFPDQDTWDEITAWYVPPIAADWAVDEAWAICMITPADDTSTFTSLYMPAPTPPVRTIPATPPTPVPPSAAASAPGPTSTPAEPSAQPTTIAVPQPTPDGTPVPVTDTVGELRASPGFFPTGTCFHVASQNLIAQTPAYDCDQPHAWQLVGYTAVQADSREAAAALAVPACRAMWVSLPLDQDRLDTLVAQVFLPTSPDASGAYPLACGLRDGQSLDLVGDALTGTLR